ncbi:WbuC family cupin fold metalloprotein [Klebsiella pneumoniae]|uniref:WbuC family cupin fold metalloprotein n=1 Tax=Klebsiella pneumoniae TaxID=573 RepID=UPI003862B361
MTILHSTDFFKAGISTVAIEPRLPQSAFPEHHHDFHEIVIVEQGSGIHVFNGQPYTIGGGSVCFIRDHDRHLYEHTDNLCLTNVLYRAPDAFRFLAGVSQLLPQEQEGNYPSHWRVNQTVLQQVRHIVAQIEAVGSDTDTHAVASREILFMQLLVLLPGTYVRPHRHPHTFELLLPLRGRFVVLNFDDRGTVTHRAILGETCTVLEMAAGTWHAVLSLDTGGIIFEVKHGGYQPVAADDYAHWAPAEGEPGTTELMAWYAQAQVGDSTFAV